MVALGSTYFENVNVKVPKRDPKRFPQDYGCVGYLMPMGDEHLGAEAGPLPQLHPAYTISVALGKPVMCDALGGGLPF